jgi:DNA-binding transcriptional LysR family regulator
VPATLEIRHLAALVTIAQERSLRAAAERLGCSESALSERVAQLESAVGLPVLVRSKGSRPGRLTDAGRALLPHAEAILDRLEAARADLLASETPDELRVGVYSGVPLRLLPSILRRLGGFRITPCEGRDDLELLNGLRYGRLDLTFAALPLPAGPFDYLRLMEEPYVLLMSDKGQSASNGVDLGDAPVVAYSSSQVLRAIETHTRSAPRPLHIVERRESEDSIRELVIHGVGGAAILPRHSAEAGDMALAVSLEGFLPLHTTVLAWHRHRELPTAASRFREAAAEVFARAVRPDREP